VHVYAGIAHAGGASPRDRAIALPGAGAWRAHASALLLCQNRASVQGATMTDTIRFSTEGPIARLLLNHPERHNALGRVELDAISAALTAVSADSSLRVLVVTGAGERTFCAGASLKDLDAGRMRGDDYQDMTEQLAALAIPTVCALNGNVFGGGVELALACDFRIGVQGSRLRVPAASLGLCYPVRGIERFVQRLGLSAAQRILVAAETLSADDMLRIGFLDHLLMPAEFADAVSRYAQQLAALAPLSLKAMKAIALKSAAGRLDLAEATALASACEQSADLREGFAAMREKRPPVFQGC